MILEIQKKLRDNPKMLTLLRENSYWYKQLNRSSENYELFLKEMKEKYKLKFSDKVASAIDGIDMISSVLNVLKD